MRRIFLRQMAHDDLAKLLGVRMPRSTKPLADLKAFGAIMSVFVALGAVGLAAFVLLAWLAWDTHEFGPKDPRYWVFIRGTLIERVGAIDAERRTLTFGAQGRDSDGPGSVTASYTSKVAQDALLSRFAVRCRAVGLEATASARPLEDGSRGMTCARTADDAFALNISVSAATPAEVVMSEDIDD